MSELTGTILSRNKKGSESLFRLQTLEDTQLVRFRRGIIGEQQWALVRWCEIGDTIRVTSMYSEVECAEVIVQAQTIEKI